MRMRMSQSDICLRSLSVFRCASRTLLYCRSDSVGMHMGNVPHVMPDLVFLGLEDVVLGFLRLARGFVPEADIEMRIKQALIEQLAVRRILARGCEYVVGLELALIELVNLHHRNARVVIDW